MVDFTHFEKTVLIDFLKTIKTNTNRIVGLMERNLSEREKTNDLLQKLLQMLENE